MWSPGTYPDVAIVWVGGSSSGLILGLLQLELTFQVLDSQRLLLDFQSRGGPKTGGNDGIDPKADTVSGTRQRPGRRIGGRHNDRRLTPWIAVVEGIVALKVGVGGPDPGPGWLLRVELPGLGNVLGPLLRLHALDGGGGILVASPELRMAEGL